MSGFLKRRKILVAAVFSVFLVVFGSAVVPSGNTYADDNALVTCASSGAAESLGWILCPIMDMLGGASEGIYNDAVKPNLQVEPELFTGKGKATRDAWGTFRDIANGLLIVLFLAVIFSQLTGVGIDNYGIKKILPKLIVAAVLMNLSYWVCVAFVDLSNIVGNGIQSLFDGLGQALNYEKFTITEDAGEVAVGIAASAGSTLVSVAIIAALVAGGGYALFTNPAMLLGVLIAAIGVIVSIFFLFILLAVRQAAIVVLVVLSPLAIACYMLPNTKNIFDKWLKLFEALLLVYPICSLLVGGGNYVSRLLLKAGFGDTGLFGAITAMVVGIVPIFFFPTVLKKSFSGMGDIGERITRIGDRTGNRLQGGVQNSRAYKRAQAMGQERQTRFRAGVDKNGNLTKGGQRRLNRISAINRFADERLAQGGRVSKAVGGAAKSVAGGMTNDMAADRAQFVSDLVAQDRADRMVNGAGLDATLRAQRKRAESDLVDDYMVLINDATRNGEDEDALLTQFDKYVAEGDTSGAVAVARIAGRRKDTAASFAQKRLTSAGEGGPSIGNMYDSEMLQAVAKELSTGESSGQYRTSAPLAFEFAAQLNRGTAGTQDYNTWVTQGDNANRAMDNYVTSGTEMMGLKNSSLNEIADLMQSGRINGETADRLQRLAQDTLDNRDKMSGTWDSTKETSIRRIAELGASTTTTGGADAGAATAAGTAGARAEAAGTADATNVAGAGGIGTDTGSSGAAAVAGVGAAAGAAVGAAAAESAINRNTPQAPAAAINNPTQQVAAVADNSGELTIQHDDASRTTNEAARPQVVVAESTTQSQAAPVQSQAAPVQSQAAPVRSRTTPAQSRLEIAHSMNDSRLREAQRNVDAQNQGNRRWPGNPQTPRGV